MNSKTRDWPMIGRRIGYALSFLLVAGVAARVSYGHIRDLAIHAHQAQEVALLLPLAVDGMMLIATLAMSQDKAANRHPRGWARSGFWFGAVISTAANVSITIVEHGWDWLSIGVAALAPVLLLWAIEIVARPGKPKATPAISESVTTPETVEAITSDSLPQAPVSPAPAGKRGDYGPRDGVAYKPRTERRKRTGK
jgi:hypothetical protein